MAVEEIKAIYSARGRKFENKEEAEKWDALASAHEEYERAIYRSPSAVLWVSIKQ